MTTTITPRSGVFGPSPAPVRDVVLEVVSLVYGTYVAVGASDGDRWLGVAIGVGWAALVMSPLARGDQRTSPWVNAVLTIGAIGTIGAHVVFALDSLDTVFISSAVASAVVLVLQGTGAVLRRTDARSRRV